MKPVKKEPESKRRRHLLWLLLLLLFGYTTYRMVRTDPNLRKVRELQNELFSSEAANLSPEDRATKFAMLREASEKLSLESRRELAQDGQKRFEAELDRYWAMSPAEKAKYLDERIDRAEKARQNWQARANQQKSSEKGPIPAATAPPSNGGPRGGQRGGTPEEREKRKKQQLDRTTPELRAKMDQYFRELQSRRQQRGLPAMPGR